MQKILLCTAVQLILLSGAYPQNQFESIWVGTLSAPLNFVYAAELSLEQKGKLLEGVLTLKNTNGKDSSAARLVGTYENNIMYLRGTDFIYKSLGNCLSVIELTHDVAGNSLVGTWSGNWKLSTCPPGGSGKIELKSQLQPDTGLMQAAVTPSYKIGSEDIYGVGLVKELASRKSYGLFIGVETYPNSTITQLDQPVQDAHNIKDALVQNYGFEETNSVVLANPTRAEIINALDGINEKLTEKDQLLIFFAGHGIWDEKLNQGYWLPSDSRKDSKAQWLSNSTIRDYIGGINSKHTLLITDACFSGSIFKERSVEFGDSKAILEMYKLNSRKAMTSGALNTVPDESVFVKYLVKSLQSNALPLISAEELFNSFKIAVINNSPNGQVPQYGPIGQVGDEGGSFIFMRRQ